MRARSRAAMCAALAVSSLVPLAGETVGVRLQAPASMSAASLTHLRREFARIVRPADMDVRWVAEGEAADGRRVAVRLAGDCDAAAAPRATAGPLGWTSAVDGRVAPFIAVNCDRVRATIAPELERWPAHLREWLFGRALARVLAHEMHHALARSHGHADHGLTKASLNARDLTMGTYRMDAEDFAAPPTVASAAPVPAAARSVAASRSESPADAPAESLGESR